MDLSRAAFVFSHLWLASMLAMPLTLAVAKSADPALRMGLCSPCVAARALPPYAARLGQRLDPTGKTI